MSDQFLGEIRLFALNFEPAGWAFCNGQLLPISRSAALFSLLGTFYGGDGRSNFALPNLQGMVPVHQGQGAGLSNYSVGQTGGTAAVTLTPQQNGPHIHSLSVDTDQATLGSPANAILMKGHWSDNNEKGAVIAYSGAAPSATMNAASIAAAGNSLPHNNLMPYLPLNFCIALQGIFPQRS